MKKRLYNTKEFVAPRSKCVSKITHKNTDYKIYTLIGFNGEIGLNRELNDRKQRLNFLMEDKQQLEQEREWLTQLKGVKQMYRKTAPAAFVKDVWSDSGGVMS